MAENIPLGRQEPPAAGLPRYNAYFDFSACKHSEEQRAYWRQHKRKMRWKALPLYLGHSHCRQGETHAQARVGERVKHRHPCSECREEFAHTHKIKSEEVSKGYPQKCPTCERRTPSTNGWVRDLTREGVEPNPGPTCHKCGKNGHDGSKCRLSQADAAKSKRDIAKKKENKKKG